MNYVLLWLFIGHTAYSLALTVRIYQIAKKLSTSDKVINKTDFILGLFAILLGPLAFKFITFPKD